MPARTEVRARQLAKARQAYELLWCSLQPQFRSWQGAMRARERAMERAESWCAGELDKLRRALEPRVQRLTESLLVSRANDAELTKAVDDELVRHIASQLATGVSTGQGGIEGSVQGYVGWAAGVSEEAGQWTLDALGLNRTFRWHGVREFRSDMFALRGSKIIQGMYGSHMDALARIIEGATRPGAPTAPATALKQIQDKWSGLTRYQAQRIARTETAAVWTQTHYNTMRANGITHAKVLNATGPLIGVESDEVDELCRGFAAKGAQSVDVMDLPPFHPNCRCTIVEVLQNPETGEYWTPPSEPFTGQYPMPPLAPPGEPIAPFPTGGIVDDLTPAVSEPAVPAFRLVLPDNIPNDIARKLERQLKPLLDEYDYYNRYGLDEFKATLRNRPDGDLTAAWINPSNPEEIFLNRAVFGSQEGLEKWRASVIQIQDALQAKAAQNADYMRFLGGDPQLLRASLADDPFEVIVHEFGHHIDMAWKNNNANAYQSLQSEWSLWKLTDEGRAALVRELGNYAEESFEEFRAELFLYAQRARRAGTKVDEGLVRWMDGLLPENAPPLATKPPYPLPPPGLTYREFDNFHDARSWMDNHFYPQGGVRYDGTPYRDIRAYFNQYDETARKNLATYLKGGQSAENLDNKLFLGNYKKLPVAAERFDGLIDKELGEPLRLYLSRDQRWTHQLVKDNVEHWDSLSPEAQDDAIRKFFAGAADDGALLRNPTYTKTMGQADGYGLNLAIELDPTEKAFYIGGYRSELLLRRDATFRVVAYDAETNTVTLRMLTKSQVDELGDEAAKVLAPKGVEIPKELKEKLLLEPIDTKVKLDLKPMTPQFDLLNNTKAHSFITDGWSPGMDRSATKDSIVKMLTERILANDDALEKFVKGYPDEIRTWFSVNKPNEWAKVGRRLAEQNEKLTPFTDEWASLMQQWADNGFDMHRPEGAQIAEEMRRILRTPNQADQEDALVQFMTRIQGGAYYDARAAMTTLSNEAWRNRGLDIFDTVTVYGVREGEQGLDQLTRVWFSLDDVPADLRAKVSAWKLEAREVTNFEMFGKAKGGIVKRYRLDARTLAEEADFDDLLRAVRNLKEEEIQFLVYEEVNKTIQTWAQSSWGGYGAGNKGHAVPLSVKVQEIALKTFTMDPKTQKTFAKGLEKAMTERGFPQAWAALKKRDDFLELMLREMYAETQAQFAARGITHVSLYRGTGALAGRSKKLGTVSITGNPTVELKLVDSAFRPLNSWSSSLDVSRGFARGRNLLAADIPVENIIGTARTGFGCLTEYEYIVLGAPGDALVIPAKQINSMTASELFGAARKLTGKEDQVRALLYTTKDEVLDGSIKGVKIFDKGGDPELLAYELKGNKLAPVVWDNETQTLYLNSDWVKGTKLTDVMWNHTPDLTEKLSDELGQQAAFRVLTDTTPEAKKTRERLRELLEARRLGDEYVLPGGMKMKAPDWDGWTKADAFQGASDEHRLTTNPWTDVHNSLREMLGYKLRRGGVGARIMGEDGLLLDQLLDDILKQQGIDQAWKVVVGGS
jgi:hypothetical protein